MFIEQYHSVKLQSFEKMILLCDSKSLISIFSSVDSVNTYPCIVSFILLYTFSKLFDVLLCTPISEAWILVSFKSFSSRVYFLTPFVVPILFLDGSVLVSLFLRVIFNIYMTAWRIFKDIFKEIL